MFEFSYGLVRLRDMHVHLIAIEVRIVRRTDRKIESESIVR